MQNHHASYGKWKRGDNEEFDISAVLYESPATYNYWLVHYNGVHQHWGSMKFTLIIPKSIANTVALAKALMGAGPLDQVKSDLNYADDKGRTLTLCCSPSGWTLV